MCIYATAQLVDVMANDDDQLCVCFTRSKHLANLMHDALLHCNITRVNATHCPTQGFFSRQLQTLVRLSSQYKWLPCTKPEFDSCSNTRYLLFASVASNAMNIKTSTTLMPSHKHCGHQTFSCRCWLPQNFKNRSNIILTPTSTLFAKRQLFFPWLHLVQVSLRVLFIHF